MSETSAPVESTVQPTPAPPPAARPAETPEDPVRELTRMAEALARMHNRRLLVEYLRCRRNLR